MGPPWPRLALSSLVRADQRGPVSIVVASLRVARSGKLLIRFHFLPLRSVSDRPNPHPRPLPEGRGDFSPPSRERRGSRWRHRRVETESLGRDRLRWCTLATPGIGPGRSRPRHACRNLGGVCKWVTHVGGRNRILCCSIGIIVLVLRHICNCQLSR